MRRLAILGVGLGAVVASGVLSAGAWAAPVYKECVRHSGGHYTSKECTPASEVPGTGKYELEEVAPGSKIAFKGKLGLTKLTAPMNGGATAVECKAGKAVGKITGPGSGEAELELKLCELAGEGTNRCESPGDRAGVITTAKLTTELVELPGARPGLRLSAAGPLFELTCRFFGGIDVAYTGSVLGEVAGNLGVASKEQQLNFRLTPGGRQEFTNVEGGTEGEDELLYTASDADEESGPAGLQAAETSKTKAAIGIF